MYQFKRHNIDRYNKFLYGDHNLSNLVVVEKIERYILPMTDVRHVDVLGITGKRLMRNKLGARTIRLTLRFIEEAYEAVQERVLELAPLLYSKTPQKIELRDSPLYNIGIVTEQTPIDRMLNTGSGELMFTCFDPFNYGEVKTHTITEAPITNPGYETEGIFRLTVQDGTEVRVRLNNGKSIILNGTFASGGQLVIDTEKELATLNGNNINNQINYYSDFFSIPSGNFTIQLSGASGSLDIQERWL